MGSMYAELFEDDVAAPSGTKVVQAPTESGTLPTKGRNQGRAGGDGQVPEPEVEGQEMAPVEEPGTEAPMQQKVKKFTLPAGVVDYSSCRGEHRGCRRGDHQLDLC